MDAELRHTLISVRAILLTASKDMPETLAKPERQRVIMNAIERLTAAIEATEGGANRKSRLPSPVLMVAICLMFAWIAALIDAPRYVGAAPLLAYFTVIGGCRLAEEQRRK